MEMMNDDNDMSMMNVDENVLDDLKDYVGTSYILESLNPPILSRHVSNITTSYFHAYRHNLKGTFTSHYVWLVDDICDGCIGSSMTFQESSNKYFTNDNDE
jgi:hypothetical protein